MNFSIKCLEFLTTFNKATKHSYCYQLGKNSNKWRGPWVRLTDSRIYIHLIDVIYRHRLQWYQNCILNNAGCSIKEVSIPLTYDQGWLMQHRLHWGRSEDTTFPRLCQPRSKVPHPTMGDTCNHAPSASMTLQGVRKELFSCFNSQQG